VIYNIRGTHGAGKSTIIQALMKQYDSVAIGRPGKRPEGYKISAPEFRKPVYIVGPYATACGGCDAIQPYDLIWPRVLEYSKKGHVVFEGALISTSVGSIGEAMAKRKDCVVLYLDTPVEVCIERVQARRAKKGDTRPLNPKNTISKHAAIARTKDRLEALGVRCELLNHKKAYKQFLEVLLEGSKS
jgi:shikimate kinase